MYGKIENMAFVIKKIEKQYHLLTRMVKLYLIIDGIDMSSTYKIIDYLNNGKEYYIQKHIIDEIFEEALRTKKFGVFDYLSFCVKHTELLIKRDFDCDALFVRDQMHDQIVYVKIPKDPSQRIIGISADMFQ